jgi:hypothetical protein
MQQIISLSTEAFCEKFRDMRKSSGQQKSGKGGKKAKKVSI